jgi:hypothetical protein
MKRRSFLSLTLAAASAPTAVVTAVKPLAAYVVDDAPFVVGQVLSVPGKAIDPKELIYKFHRWAITDVTMVRDGGHELEFYEDCPANSVPVPPPPGHYSTCKELGMVIVGTKPQFELTGDVFVDNMDGEDRYGFYLS